MKTSKIVLFAALFLILFGVIFILIVNDSYKYKITYEDKQYTYEIKVYEKIIKVYQKECNIEPCDKVKINEYKIDFMREDMNRLYDYLDNLIYNNREITIKYEDLDTESFPIFNSIINNNSELLDYNHKIEYIDNQVSYNIYIDNDYNIKVLTSCNDISCKKNYQVIFNEENKKYIKEYLEKNIFNTTNNISINSNNTNKETLNILNSIIMNSEEDLNNITTNNISYKIKYFGVNCETSLLELYNDNTYKYIYGYDEKNNEYLSKTGTYNFDIDKILVDNIDIIKSEYYQIISKDNIKYLISTNNIEINRLLNTLNINLKTCYTVN